MSEDEFIRKLESFKQEFLACKSFDEFDGILERLRRKLLEIYDDNDPFVRRCSVSWGMLPSMLGKLGAFLH